MYHDCGQTGRGIRAGKIIKKEFVQTGPIQDRDMLDGSPDRVYDGSKQFRNRNLKKGADT